MSLDGAAIALSWIAHVPHTKKCERDLRRAAAQRDADRSRSERNRRVPQNRVRRLRAPIAGMATMTFLRRPATGDAPTSNKCHFRMLKNTISHERQRESQQPLGNKKHSGAIDSSKKEL